MFYDVFNSLCATKGVSCKKASLEMGLSNSIATKWKKTGAIPNGETLNIIAEYFGVSTDYLLGAESKSTSAAENEKSPAPEGAELTPDQIRAIEKIKNMPPEELARKMAALEAVLDM